MDQVITENGITISVTENHANPNKSSTFYNPVMRIGREFMLSAIGAYCSDRTGATKCLDAFGASGMAGLQWKHHVTSSPLDLTINDADAVCVESIKSNCVRNDFTVRTHSLLDDELPGNSIEVSHKDANLLLHERQFNFISLDPFGTTVQFLDAAFRNVYHKGMLVLTATDIAALYGKCPQVMLRNYGAYTVRTDYIKEIAVRILLAEAARSAAKCNKGFDVVYSVAVEHFVQVGLKIKRGANHGNQAMSLIGQILHCQHCHEWGQLPITHSPIEQPYSHLPCECQAKKGGETSVVLGPMWLGKIFCTDFLKKMSIKASEFKLSDRIRTLLQTMEVESLCPHSTSTKPVNVTLNTLSKQSSAKLTTLTAETTDRNSEKNGQLSSNSKEVQNNTTSVQENSAVLTSSVQDENKDLENVRQKSDREKTNKLNSTSRESVNSISRQNVSETRKRDLDASDNRGCCEEKKRRISVRGYEETDMPMFYYNLHLRGVKNVDLPKIPRLLSKLHTEGFRGCKTSFDPHAVRTDATLKELSALMLKYFAQNSS